MDGTDLVRVVPALLHGSPAIRSVSLVGSRQRGDATIWSDWDFKVRADDFAAVAQVLPTLIAPLEPLAAQWDRLSDEQCYMLIVDGPQKIDLIFDEPHVHQPPHAVSATTLTTIDAHFWDWALWLTSKVGVGRLDLLATELAKMTDHLLGPLGIVATPGSLTDAVDAYLSARTNHEERFGAKVPRELGRQVERVIRKQASELS